MSQRKANDFADRGKLIGYVPSKRLGLVENKQVMTKRDCEIVGEFEGFIEKSLMSIESLLEI